MKKFVPAAALLLMIAPLLFAQSLSELSKKERERRDALRGKRAAVITNADLGKLKKGAGLETSPSPPAPAPSAEASVPAEAETAPAPVAEPVEAGEETVAEAEKATKADLVAKHAKAKEYADLLELKMGALWQEFYALGDTRPKEAVQQEIALTFDKLEKAREDEARAGKELEDFLIKAGEASAPAIWIR